MIKILLLSDPHPYLSSAIVSELVLLMTIILSSILPVSCSAQTNLEINIIPNLLYHEGGDPFSLDVTVSNPGDEQIIDLYLAIELADQYYFYPGFTTDIDCQQLHLAHTTPNQHTRLSIIPMIQLPQNLPIVRGSIYAVCLEPNTNKLLSNVAVEGFYLQTSWPELPLPDINNTFFFLPGDHSLKFSNPEIDFQTIALELQTHFPIQGPYMRTGISLIDPITSPQDRSRIMETLSKASPSGLAVAFHCGVTPHHVFGSLDTLRKTDRRYNQWESDGKIYDIGESDLTALTLSRNATDLVAMREAIVIRHADGFREGMESYPNNLICISGPIEVELRRAFPELPHYADYSPFTIQEFRDWLCHAGLYDDHIGQYKGEGVPRAFIDNLDFSKDPAPDIHLGAGLSFNAYFGTHFTTWDLAFWDPTHFPEPLPDTANPLPGDGETGYIPGGFDAPRSVNGQLIGGNDLFKKLWDGYESDLMVGYQYGYGFRQMLVTHYVLDNARWMVSHGIPVDRIYTHQIPADFINNWIRFKSSASPFWTAVNDYSNPGFTVYQESAYQELLFSFVFSQYEQWGIFEYHPDPYLSHPKAYFNEALAILYRTRPRVVVPIELHGSSDGLFRLLGTPYETAWQEFFTATWPDSNHRRFDQPYTNITWIDYLPPSVNDIHFTDGTLTWSPVIWPDRPDITWNDWGEFDHFEIFSGDAPEFVPNAGNRIARTKSYSISDLDPGHYKILAISRVGLPSAH